METVREDVVEEYSWRDVKVPALASQSEHRKELGERRGGRDILVAVDHGPKSKFAFDWVLAHLCRTDDTVHLIHAVSSYFNFTIFFIVLTVNPSENENLES